MIFPFVAEVRVAVVALLQLLWLVILIFLAKVCCVFTIWCAEFYKQEGKIITRHVVVVDGRLEAVCRGGKTSMETAMHRCFKN